MKYNSVCYRVLFSVICHFLQFSPLSAFIKYLNLTFWLFAHSINEQNPLVPPNVSVDTRIICVANVGLFGKVIPLLEGSMLWPSLFKLPHINSVGIYYLPPVCVGSLIKMIFLMLVYNYCFYPWMFKFTKKIFKRKAEKTRKAHYFWLRGQIKDHTC